MNRFQLIIRCALRFGSLLAISHTCVCGATVDQLETQGFCKKFLKIFTSCPDNYLIKKLCNKPVYHRFLNRMMYLGLIVGTYRSALD